MRNRLKIEILFPEICNLYGDIGNVAYLRAILKDRADFIMTSIREKPRFLDEEVSLVYLGSCAESAYEDVLENLLKYRQEIIEKIDEGQLMLFTGTGFDLLSDYIEVRGDERVGKVNKRINGFRLFSTYVKLDLNNRFNSFSLAEFRSEKGSIDVVGFKSQFTKMYSLDDNPLPSAFEVKRGVGINETANEGLRYKNVFGTYLLGALLPLNPLFTEYLLRDRAGYKGELDFQKEALAAYNARLVEFRDTNRSIG